MAKKISIEELTTVLSTSVENEEEKQRILTEVRNFLASLEDDTEPEPPVETRDVTIIFGNQEALDMIDTDTISAFTVKIEATADHNQVIPQLLAKAAVYNQNLTRRQTRIQNLGETFGLLSPKKHLEGFPKRILTKEPALVITTTNLAIQPAVVVR